MKLAPNSYSHSPGTLRFWRALVQRAMPHAPTPFYLFSLAPIREALAELDSLGRASPVPVRHWLSFKTQPVRPLVQWWQSQGRGVEVVSEFEFLAARKEGFSPERILVNGPAKHRWLPRHRVRGICVNFDSRNEALALLPMAKKLDWSVGIRCHTREEFDPDRPEFPTQFGMQAEEAVTTLQELQSYIVRLETVHFHLRTNVSSPEIYACALADVVAICRSAGFAPKYLDCGGGLPAPNILSHAGKRYDARLDLKKLARVYERALTMLPSVRELWLENGRFLSARSGVLVLRVLDVKERQNMRHLIYDGGRTMNALVSNWETHEMFTVPRRQGPLKLTTICGPTCMAFDQLARRPMAASIRSGDYLVWMDAGAYHVSWETRFSHGWAPVIWHDGQKLSVVREAESFDQWWGQWE